MLIRVIIGGPSDGQVNVLYPEIVTPKVVVVGTWREDTPDIHPNGYYAFETYTRLKDMPEFQEP